LGQQAAIYPWAGVSGNRWQPTTGQGPRATGGNLPLGRGLGVSGTQRDSSCEVWPQHRSHPAGTVQNTGGRCTQRESSEHRWSVHTAGAVQNTGGRCTQRGQFRTRVGGAHSRHSSGHRWSSAHNRDSSGHGWSVHTAGGTVQNTGGRCTQRAAGTVQDTGGQSTQQGQFRTRLVGAHSGDSSEHGWSVHTAGSGDSSGHRWSVHTTGTVQDTGGRCTQRGQFR
ncbi:unnamed protein product, partial [Staurois parvus]